MRLGFCQQTVIYITERDSHVQNSSGQTKMLIAAIAEVIYLRDSCQYDRNGFTYSELNDIVIVYPLYH